MTEPDEENRPPSNDNTDDKTEGQKETPSPEAIAAPEAAQEAGPEVVIEEAPSTDDALLVVATAPANADAGEGIAPAHVVAFWRDAGQERWFVKDEALDGDIRARFEALHHKAARGELDDWADEPAGALALLLLLDQFPRNLYRGSAHAFATDPLARQIAGRAIERGFDQQAADDMRVFFYLPFEHSEDARDQENAIALMSATGDDDLAHWAQVHADIIARFGRFPHRNACLGRVTTDAEHRFLDEGGFSG